MIQDILSRYCAGSKVERRVARLRLPLAQMEAKIG